MRLACKPFLRLATCTFGILLLLNACSPLPEKVNTTMAQSNNESALENPNRAELNLSLATFGAGCFWCVEAVFESLVGVHYVISGYMGGPLDNPSYEEICTGKTGHAEVIQIHYDSEVISYERLLERFWIMHNPTTLNRQGADVGTQYRSVIFTHSNEQNNLAQSSKLGASVQFHDPIVTEITPASQFYPAEKYHQNFYRENPAHPYCQFVIRQKLQSLEDQ